MQIKTHAFFTKTEMLLDFGNHHFAAKYIANVHSSPLTQNKMNPQCPMKTKLCSRQHLGPGRTRRQRVAGGRHQEASNTGQPSTQASAQVTLSSQERHTHASACGRLEEHSCSCLGRGQLGGHMAGAGATSSSQRLPLGHRHLSASSASSVGISGSHRGLDPAINRACMPCKPSKITPSYHPSGKPHPKCPGSLVTSRNRKESHGGARLQCGGHLSSNLGN